MTVDKFPWSGEQQVQGTFDPKTFQAAGTMANIGTSTAGSYTTLTVSGSSSLAGAVTVGGTFTLTGAATMTGGATMTGPVQVNGTLGAWVANIGSLSTYNSYLSLSGSTWTPVVSSGAYIPASSSSAAGIQGIINNSALVYGGLTGSAGEMVLENNSFRFGGSSFTGAVTAGKYQLWNDIGPTGNVSPTYSDPQYLGIGAYVHSSVNDGGTADTLGATRAWWIGVNSNVALYSGATHQSALIGFESDTGVQTGATVAHNIGVYIVQAGYHSVQGAVTDAAIDVVISNTGNPGWKMGLAFGGTQTGPQWPIASTGTIIGTLTNGSDRSLAAALGVDFSAVTFSTAAFKSSGFKVDGSGNVTANSLVFGSATFGEIYTGNGAAASFYVPASAVNYVSINAGTTGGAVTLGANGSDTNVNLYFCPKGSGTNQFTGGAQIFNLGNYANDSAAAAGGVQVDCLYRNGSVLMIRVS